MSAVRVGNLSRREVSRDRSSLFESDVQETIISLILALLTINSILLAMPVIRGSSPAPFGVSNRSRFDRLVTLINLQHYPLAYVR